MELETYGLRIRFRQVTAMLRGPRNDFRSEVIVWTEVKGLILGRIVRQAIITVTTISIIILTLIQVKHQGFVIPIRTRCLQDIIHSGIIQAIGRYDLEIALASLTIIEIKRPLT